MMQSKMSNRQIQHSFALAALVACVVLAPNHAGAVETIPDPHTYVVDKAGVIDAQTRAKIESYLRELEQKTGAQVRVLTVQSSGGESEFTFAQRHFEAWKLGQKGKDNGALILLLIKERKVWIHTGYGVEGAIPDSWAGSLSRNVREEYFRQGQYGQGLLTMAVAVANKIADEQGVKLTGVPEIRHQENVRPGIPFICGLVFFVILFLWIMSLSRRQRYRRTWGGFGPAVTWGSVLGDVLSSGSGSSWGGGGGFGGGLGGGGTFGGGGSTGGGGGGASW
jgi:uncharacterized protein